MQKSSACHILALLTVLLWSTSYVGTKVVSVSFTPGALGFLRCFSATIVLLAVIAVKKLRPPTVRDYPLFLLSGLCGIALYLILFNRGFADIGPTTSSIIVSTSPIIAAVLAYFVFKERLAALRWLAIGLAFCGILIMTLWEGTLNINAGVVWTALAAFVFAVYNLTQRGLSRRYAPVTITAYSFVAGTILLSPYLPDTLAQMRTAPPAHTVIVCLMGVFPSAIAYLLWVKALSIAPKTSYVTNYMFVTPFASLALELTILRQWPGAGAILGGAVILGSLVLFAVSGKREKK